MITHHHSSWPSPPSKLMNPPTHNHTQKTPLSPLNRSIQSHLKMHIFTSSPTNREHTTNKN